MREERKNDSTWQIGSQVREDLMHSPGRQVRRKQVPGRGEMTTSRTTNGEARRQKREDKVVRRNSKVRLVVTRLTEFEKWQGRTSATNPRPSVDVALSCYQRV